MSITKEQKKDMDKLNVFLSKLEKNEINLSKYVFMSDTELLKVIEETFPHIPTYLYNTVLVAIRLTIEKWKNGGFQNV